MDKLDKDLILLKQELKCWESMFSRKYGRKPTKEDIDESAAEIKDSYKAYAALKKRKFYEDKKTSNSLQVDDGVFGASLLKQPDNPKQQKISQLKVLDVHKVRRPVFKRVNKTTISTVGENVANVANDESIANDENVKETFKHDQPVMTFEIENKINGSSEGPARKSVSVLRRPQSLFTNYSKLSVSWLNNCSSDLPNENEKLKLSTDTDIKLAESLTVDKNNLPFKDRNFIAMESSEGRALSSEIENLNYHKKNFESSNVFGQISNLTEHSNDALVETSSSKIANTLICSLEILDTTEGFSNDIVKLHSSGLIGKNETDKNNLRVPSKNLRSSKKDSNDIKNKEDKENEKKVSEDLKKKPRNRNSKLVSEEKEIKLNECLNEEELNNKRKRTEMEPDEDKLDPKSKKIKLKKSSSKRLVSDNFVKIDLKKKTYVRGVKKLTGAQYKRRQWKQKTSFEQPNKKGWQVISEKKICYKCGGEGHWAKFCRGIRKKVDPFSKLEEEKQTIDFEDHDKNKKSFFDCIESSSLKEVDTTNLHSGKKFTIENVMEIEAVWPRQTYATEPYIPVSVCLIPPVDAKPSWEAYNQVKNELNVFGFKSFRDGQHEAIARIVSGLSTLVILSTGSGKSLCYQLPSYLYYKQKQYLTLVVSPLVALMQDQVVSLPSFLPGACLNSSMTKLQQKRVIEKVKAGKIAVLLISPEALVSGGFGSGILPMKSSLPTIAFACIDEAHCLSEWSHNFRPSYLKVCKVLRERYNISCLLGITATASHATATSVMQHLGIPLEGSIIRDPQPIPPNLCITASRDCNRDEALTELLQMKPFSSCDSIIIYVTRRTDADRLASMLRTNLPAKAPDEKMHIEKDTLKGKKKKTSKPFWWNVESYHAGLTPSQRRRVQTSFMSGELRIVVATVAFGMGLDKSDVRTVIHYNMPSSFENYVQEIGRAGRDGKLSYVHVFLDDEGNDLYELRRHIYGNTVDRSTIQKFVDIAFPACKCEELCARHERLNPNSHENMEKMTAEEINEMFSDDFCNQMINDRSLVKEIPVSESFNDERSQFDVNTNQSCDETGFPLNNSISIQIDSKICSGHRVTFNIDNTVQALDMPEVNISTLMAYLELHPKRWLQVLNPLRDMCSVKCYGGPEQFQLLAKRFAPVALAIKNLPKDQLRHLDEMRSIDFSFANIADQMCWDVFTVSREVRYLQWNMSFALDAPLNTTGHSGVIVECDQLSFHVLTAPGLNNNDRDEMCDFLYESITKQEDQRILQLDALYNLFRDLSKENCYELKTEIRVDEKARTSISNYFLCDVERQTTILKEMCTCDIKIKTSDRRWTAISNDISSLLSAYPDQNFSGRAIARIFQGIDSPCYPAWSIGRDRRFWRQYLDVDFNELRNFCTHELIKYRRH